MLSKMRKVSSLWGGGRHRDETFEDVGYYLEIETNGGGELPAIVAV